MTKLIQRDSYPEPYLWDRDGTWYCRVNVPTSLFFLFGKDSKQALSLRTNNKEIAERRLGQKANEIYDKFDQRQLEYIEDQARAFLNVERQLDDQAKGYIQRFANAFKFKLPDLSPETPVDEILAVKKELDIRRDMLEKDHPDLDTEEGLEMFQTILTLGNSEDRVGVIRFNNGFTLEQYRALARYRSMAVHTFWQDLLVNAALAQGVDAPILEEDPKNIFVPRDGLEEFLLGWANSTIKDLVADGMPEEEADQKLKDLLNDDVVKNFYRNWDLENAGFRPRQTQNPQPNQISKFLTEWDLRVDKNYDKINTRRKLKKAIQEFVDLVGDLIVDQVHPFHVFEYIDALLDESPDMARSTLNDKVWQCSSFFKMLMEKNLGIIANPFVGIDLANRGKETVSWQRFTNDELHKIFAYDWTEDQRLLLAILITTGMRLNEATQLSWERFNDTEYQGIQYFTLLSVVTDEGLEETDVKTSGSERYIIVHPDLLEILLPLRKKTGKVFAFSENYTERQINNSIAEIVNHPKKRIHSFRRTFKILYRDNMIDEKTIDALVGHAEGDASRRAYAGVGVPTRYKHLCKVRHPWLKTYEK